MNARMIFSIVLVLGVVACGQQEEAAVETAPTASDARAIETAPVTDVAPVEGDMPVDGEVPALEGTDAPVEGEATEDTSEEPPVG